VEIDIWKIIVDGRHRKDFGDLAALTASIEDVGLLQPLALRPDNVLVAGARRLAALQRLGWKRVPVRVLAGLDDELKLLRAERDENTCRKDFTPSEAVAVARSIEDRIKKQAKERQAKAGPKQGRGKKKSASGNLPEPVGGDSRDQIADAVGVSERTLQKAAVVVDAADENPEQFGPIREEMDQTGNVNGAFKKVTKARTPEPPPPRFPYSDTLRTWLDTLVGQTHIIRIQMGGIKAMLAQRDKWDWGQVSTFLVPMLEDLGPVIEEFHKEMKRACK
jgi:ParB family chromosome partitioning protein